MDARLEQDGTGYLLIVERRLAQAPEKVWRVLTERDLLRQWFPCDVEGGWALESKLRFTFLHGEGEGLPEEDLRGKVLAVDEPRLLEFLWGRHRLKYELTPEGNGTLFQLSEHFDDPSWGARNAAGWEQCLENLDLILEGVSAAKFVAKVWNARFRQYVEKFEPAFGPQQNPPEDHPLLAEGG